MDSVSLYFLVVGLTVMLFAGLVQGLTGLGFGLVAVPLMTLFISPKLAMGPILINGIAVCIIILLKEWRHVALRRTWPLMLCGALGVPIGAYLLAVLPVSALRIAIGVIVAGFGLLLIFGLRITIKRERAVSVPVGLLSGILGGAMNMPGPPAALFLSNQGLARDVFRATLVVFALITSLIAIPFYRAHGLLSAQSALAGALIIPAVFLGGWLGNKLVRRLNDRVFRFFPIAIIIATGIMSVLVGLNTMG